MQVVIIMGGEVKSTFPVFSQGEFGTVIQFQLLDEAGVAIDLRTYTYPTVTFSARLLNDYNELLFSKLCTIIDASSGVCQYTLQSTDLWRVGSYEAFLKLSSTSTSDTVSLGSLEVSDVPNYLNPNTVIDGVATTDDLPEGSVNLYYTAERAKAAISTVFSDSSTVDFTYDSESNQITASVIESQLDHTNLQNIGVNTHAQLDTHVSSTSNPHQVTLEQARTAGNYISGDINANSNTITGLKTPSSSTDAATKGYVDSAVSGIDIVIDGLDHGALGGLSDDDHTQYLTEGRANTWLATKSTSDISEGTNLYYTDERVDDRVSNLVQDSTYITWAYDDTNNTLTANLGSITESQISDLQDYALDNSVVHTTGDESIGGVKTFTNNVVNITSASSAQVRLNETENTNEWSLNADTNMFNIQEFNGSGTYVGSALKINRGGEIDFFRDLDMNNHSISNLSSPSLEYDAATKNYVDTSVVTKADATTLTNHIADTNNPHEVTATQLGLENVDNTSDLSKPISTATQTALDLKATDTNVVHKTGDETISGNKTFSGSIYTEQSFLGKNHNNMLTFNAYYSSGWKYFNNGYGFRIKLESSDGRVGFALSPYNSSGESATSTLSEVLRLYQDYTVKLKDGVGVSEFSNDSTLADSSTTALVTEYAIKTYVDTNISSSVSAHTSLTNNPHSVSLEQARLVNNTLSGNISMGGNSITSLATPSSDADAATKGYVDSVAQGLSWEKAVLDKSLSTPPSSPTTGDRYIINPTGTGAWASHDNQIAEWNGSSWDFTTLVSGQTVYVTDEGVYYRWNGTEWVEFISAADHGTLTGLGDDDHTQYLNNTRADTWLATKSTSDLSEGSNLYFTNERVDDRVASLVQNSTNVTWTYNDTSNTLTANIGTITESQISDLQDYALDNSVVHTTGDESIGGVKTFTNNVVNITNSANAAIKFNESTEGNEWRINAEGGTQLNFQQFNGSGNFERNAIQIYRDSYISTNSALKVTGGITGSVTINSGSSSESLTFNTNSGQNVIQRFKQNGTEVGTVLYYNSDNRMIFRGGSGKGIGLNVNNSIDPSFYISSSGYVYVPSTYVKFSSDGSGTGIVDFNFGVLKNTAIFPNGYDGGKKTNNFILGYQDILHNFIDRGKTVTVTGNDGTYASSSISKMFDLDRERYLSFTGTDVTNPVIEIDLDGAKYINQIYIGFGYRNMFASSYLLEVYEDDNNDGTYQWTTVADNTTNNLYDVIHSVTKWRCTKIRFTGRVCGDSDKVNQLAIAFFQAVAFNGGAYTHLLPSTGGILYGDLDMNDNNLSNVGTIDSTDVVHTTGNESIGGVKTFTNNTVYITSASSAQVRLNETENTNEWSLNADTNMFNIQEFNGSGTYVGSALKINRGGEIDFFRDLDMNDNNLSNVGTIDSTDVVHTTGNESIGGTKTFTSTIQATGSSSPSSGIGIELRYKDSKASILGYDRDTSAYLPVDIRGSSIAMNISGSDVAEFISTGLDMNSKVISNLATPSNNADAATKAYVDSAISSSGGSFFISVGTDSNSDYVCDGTNDEVQIQSAINEAYLSGGGIVLIKAGTYNVSNAVYVGSNVWIRGEGVDATTLNVSSWSSGSAVFTNSWTDNGTTYYQGRKNIRVTDMTLKGNETNISSVYFHGNQSSHAQDYSLYIDSVIVSNVNGYDFGDSTQASSASVGSNLKYAKDSIFNNVKMYDAANDGIHFEYVLRQITYKCSVYRNKRNVGFHYHRAWYSIFSECYAEDTYSDGFQIKGRDPDADGAYPTTTVTTDGGSTITLASTSNFSENGYCKIGSEFIYYSSKSSTQLLGCVRNVYDTPDATGTTAEAIWIFTGNKILNCVGFNCGKYTSRVSTATTGQAFFVNNWYVWDTEIRGCKAIMPGGSGFKCSDEVRFLIIDDFTCIGSNQKGVYPNTTSTNSHITLNNIKAFYNQNGIGLTAQDNIIVTNSELAYNSQYGVSGNNNCTYINCKIHHNGFTTDSVGGADKRGMQLNGSGCVVDNCVVEYNIDKGIQAGTYTVIKDSSISYNGDTGVLIGTNSKVINSFINNNGDNGVSVGDYSVIERCEVKNNTNKGIDDSNQTMNYTDLIRNTVTGNGENYNINYSGVNYTIEPGYSGTVLPVNSSAIGTGYLSNGSLNISLDETNDLVKFTFKKSNGSTATYSPTSSSGSTIDMSNNVLKNVKTVTFYGEYDNGSSGTAKTIDFGNGQNQKVTLTGNCTFTFTAPLGVGTFKLKLIQDTTGGRSITWPSTVKWPGGITPTPTSTASAIDIISIYYDGTNYYAQGGMDFS